MQQSFWDHLEVFRWTLIRIAAAVGIFTVVAFVVLPFIFDPVILKAAADADVKIININVTGPFFTHMKVSLLLGLLAAFPYLVWELCKFIWPALYNNEKKALLPVLVGAALLFYCGCAAGYFLVFPITFKFLALYQIGDMFVSEISLASYISTFVSIIFVMGVLFELPIVIAALGRLGLVSRQLLRKYRSHIIVALLILAAVVTPTGDPFTLMVVFLPLYLLFEISILLVPSAQRETIVH